MRLKVPEHKNNKSEKETGTIVLTGTVVLTY